MPVLCMRQQGTIATVFQMAVQLQRFTQQTSGVICHHQHAFGAKLLPLAPYTVMVGVMQQGQPWQMRKTACH